MIGFSQMNTDSYSGVAACEKKESYEIVVFANLKETETTGIGQLTMLLLFIWLFLF